MITKYSRAIEVIIKYSQEIESRYHHMYTRVVAFNERHNIYDQKILLIGF